MASLRKKDRSPYFFACFTGPTGRRVQVSTKQTDRRRALAFAEKLEKAARLAAESRLGEIQARKIVGEIFEAVNQTALPSTTTRDFLLTWAERSKGNNAPRTSQAYAQVARDFLASLGTRADIDISQISRADVSRYREVIRERTSTSTSNKHLKYLRAAFAAAIRDGYAQDNPAKQVLVLKKDPREGVRRRPFTETELRDIFKAADGEWRGLILFAFYTGQRLKDIASLRWSNVDLVKRELTFVTAKTGRPMHLPLTAPVVEYLTNSPGNDNPQDPLFPKSFPLAHKSHGDSRLSQQFHSILVSVGLAKPRSKEPTGQGHAKKRTLSAISFHSLRHTSTTYLKQSGASEAVAMDIVGHDSKAISRVYTTVDVESKRRAVDALPNVFGL
jgi:integrase